MDDRTIDLTEMFSPPDFDTWRELVTSTLKGRGPEQLTRHTLDGLTIAALYTEPVPEVARAGLPDASRALDRRQAGWDIRQRHDLGALEDVARWVAADMKRGVRSVQLALGSGPDGLAIHHAVHLGDVLASAPLDATPVDLDAGSTAPGALAILLALARERGVPGSMLTGSVPIDPVATLARSGRLDAPIDAWWDVLAHCIAWADEHAPWVHLVGADGLIMRDAGASAPQELAWSLASGALALRQLHLRGISPARVAPRVIVRAALGRVQFTEIAKLRALRVVWAKLLGALGVEGVEVFVHATSSSVALTQRDPWVNMLRATMQGFVGAVAGADAITLTPFDRAGGLPGDLARRVASNTQVVLEAEAHLGRVADPAAGSWYVDRLTDDIARQAWSIFQDIERRGGAVAVLEDGWWRDQLDAVFDRRTEHTRRRKAALVGVSEFANLEEAALERPPMPEFSSAPLPAVDLCGVSDAAGAARIQAAVEAASLGATRQQLTEALLGAAGGAHVLDVPFRARSLASPWEALRDRADAMGARPRAFLANLGPIPAHKARADFATRLLQAGGIEVCDHDGVASAVEAASAFAASGADGVVICGTDDAYAEHAQALARSLGAHAPAFIALAGRPGAHEEAWRAAGIEHFMHLSCDGVALLDKLLGALGGEP
ncbi:MAG: methylmalonyl-CoA mutase family protein [Myxococcota bacterium]